MASGYAIRRNRYYDSVFLMGVNQRLAQAEGVRQTAVLMASETNKVLLAEIGIEGDELRLAGPNDLVVAVVAETPAIVEAVLAGLDAALTTVQAATPVSDRRTLEDGLVTLPAANLAVLTIPGSYVAREAEKALEAGLNLFIFSSNVPVEEELRLKQAAGERGLLVMGPDCGTSLVNGIGLGFANAVRRGSIGAIGPSGTGLQEFTCLVHHAGAGISHAIGTGSHDLSDAIGGITTFAALDRLEADPRTEAVAIIAKPAGAATRARLVERLEACTKPVVVCLLGAEPPSNPGRLVWARTIDEAAEAACRFGREPDDFAPPAPPSPLPAAGDVSALAKHMRGLFAGGTLCYQTQQILRQAGLRVHSNAPLDPGDRIDPAEPSVGHTLLDMGDEWFTLGRLHPMIDGTLRRRRILDECADASVGVLLLDFILGYNASPDPVSDVLEAIVEGPHRRPREAGPLTVVASICGTEGDPQGLERQADLLRQAGVIVLRSNAAAARYGLGLLGHA